MVFSHQENCLNIDREGDGVDLALQHIQNIQLIPVSARKRTCHYSRTGKSSECRTSYQREMSLPINIVEQEPILMSKLTAHFDSWLYNILFWDIENYKYYYVIALICILSAQGSNLSVFCIPPVGRFAYRFLLFAWMQDKSPHCTGHQVHMQHCVTLQTAENHLLYNWPLTFYTSVSSYLWMPFSGLWNMSSREV